jgi:PKD repeat protein
MKSKFLFVVCFVSLSAFAQNTTSFVFTAINDGHYVPLESVKIVNMTRNTDTTLYWPDTVLYIYNTSAESVTMEESDFHISQNVPNPVSDKTYVNVYLPVSGEATIMVSDLSGCAIVNFTRILGKGYSSFSFSPPKTQTYLFTVIFKPDRLLRLNSGASKSNGAYSNSLKKTIKIISTTSSGDGKVKYEGTNPEYANPTKVASPKSIHSNGIFLFSPGDSLEFSGKYTIYTKGIIDTPMSSSDYTFDFNVFSMLSGDSTKIWKLLRSTATGRYPLEVGPEDHSVIWWAMGLSNQEISNRPCMLNDEFILGDDFSFVLDTKGDYWAEGGIFAWPDNICALTTNPMLGINGDDLSAWAGGNHTWELDLLQPSPRITSIGMGAYLGFFKLGNGAETLVPLDHVTYDIIEMTDQQVDTLVIEGIYYIDPNLNGYWRFVLVHYDNPADEPPIPALTPEAGFFRAVEGRTVYLSNSSKNAETYLWDFGDGQTSTVINPVHTYDADNIYNITLTATNSEGSDFIMHEVFCSTAVLTDEILSEGTWKVRSNEYAVFVGPGLGNDEWWHVTEEMLTSGTPDDWSCMPDDEFNFLSGGIYTYETMGFARNDSYFGYPNGCWSDDQINLSPGYPFGTCMNHTYTFTPVSGSNRPYIILANGNNHAAFIGFYKGYYGGENIDGTMPPNGGLPTNRYEVMGYLSTGEIEYLFVSVDITANHDGSAAWSMILERIPER